jgi:hypothetical protein
MGANDEFPLVTVDEAGECVDSEKVVWARIDEQDFEAVVLHGLLVGLEDSGDQ